MRPKIAFLAALLFAALSGFSQAPTIGTIAFSPDSVAWNSATFAKDNHLGKYANSFRTTPGNRLFFIDKNLRFSLVNPSTSSGGGTVNSLTAASSAITSNVNGAASTITPAVGTIAYDLGFSSGGALVKQVASAPNVIYATSSGTYTPTAGMKYCVVEVVGGGGGAGAVAAAAANGISISGGGGYGGYCRALVPASVIGSSKPYTVGAGGAGGTGGGAGSGGSDSYFGPAETAIAYASGGGGGGASVSTTSGMVVAGTPNYGYGNTPDNGGIDIGSTRQSAAPFGVGFVVSGTNYSYFPSWGGTQPEGTRDQGNLYAPLANASTATVNGSAVSAGANTGCGGKGGFSAWGGTASNGGNGGSGWVRITEYFQ